MTTLPAPLLSATLDRHDLETAERWLADPQLGNDTRLTGDWENRFARWLGGGTARAFMGGRAALLAVVRALGLGQGDEVIVPAFSCQCVANAIRFAGASVRYADIETDSFGLDLDATRAALGPATRAILLQHTFGLPSRDTAGLLRLAHERSLWVIEDCAHALGARWQGRLLGTLGDAAVFSFERSKIITCIHGGMAVVHDPYAADQLARLAERAPLPDDDSLRGQLASVVHDYWVRAAPERRPAAEVLPGLPAAVLPQMWPEEFEGVWLERYGQRMPSSLADLAGQQFARLPEILARRQAQAAYWRDWALARGWQVADPQPDSEPVWLRFPVLPPDDALKQSPEALAALAAELGVEIGVWFTTAAHPVAVDLPDCPVGLSAARRCLNLPTLLPAGHPHAAGS
ncbi:DegT/DnrJ/EryC1/StrS family aminotransferase [Laribacter hongkongensis]|uniref:DegT/DnrJ/EryC1/StrS family aminotransferase n=1 Tax=Laribacter hongkongensis TaxID=168471 RepID=UPI001EFEED57|nr:DegT/DnrJ/EryC1/StrS family aminotransferase [Laribacter hongkongensis]MCG9057101.1 DegT/DnrJ/EryC1/StrS family aminotransferase [Laribacter hongkongensis]